MTVEARVASCFAEVKAAGYREGVPQVGLIDGTQIDRRIAADSECDECGQKGMNFRGFTKDKGEDTYSYRAFAWCGNCGHVLEF